GLLLVGGDELLLGLLRAARVVGPEGQAGDLLVGAAAGGAGRTVVLGRTAATGPGAGGEQAGGQGQAQDRGDGTVHVLSSAGARRAGAVVDGVDGYAVEG